MNLHYFYRLFVLALKKKILSSLSARPREQLGTRQTRAEVVLISVPLPGKPSFRPAQALGREAEKSQVSHGLVLPGDPPSAFPPLRTLGL